MYSNHELTSFNPNFLFFQITGRIAWNIHVHVSFRYIPTQHVSEGIYSSKCVYVGVLCECTNMCGQDTCSKEHWIITIIHLVYTLTIEVSHAPSISKAPRYLLLLSYYNSELIIAFSIISLISLWLSQQFF